jgi:hypothetical protein
MFVAIMLPRRQIHYHTNARNAVQVIWTQPPGNGSDFSPTMPVNDAWEASYRVWREVYERPEDVVRAVVREQIALAMERLQDNSETDL